MSYNPNIHHRRSIRLKGYDYSQIGLYFVTVCVRDKQCLFGEILDGEMVLNEYGQIAYNEWMDLPKRFNNVILDVFQIMPNHFHGIIALTDVALVGATLAVAQNMVAQNAVAQNVIAQNAVTQNDETAKAMGIRAGASPAPTIGNIVGAYKSLVTNHCLKICKSKNEYMGKLWQRNYHEHIIRNEKSYQYISEYIINNPANWEKDKFYVKRNEQF